MIKFTNLRKKRGCISIVREIFIILGAIAMLIFILAGAVEFLKRK